jgi:hypothetical protein
VQDTQNTRGQTLKQTKGTDIAENPTPSCHQHRHKTVTKNRKLTGQNSGTKSQIPNSNKTEKNEAAIYTYAADDTAKNSTYTSLNTVPAALLNTHHYRKRHAFGFQQHGWKTTNT